MIFMGYAFSGGNYALDSTPAGDGTFGSITLSGGKFDTLIGSHGDKTGEELRTGDWDFDTILRALFQGDVVAGNIDYAVSEIDKLRLKRRKKGELEWVTIFDKVVTTSDDLSMIYDDPTAGIGTYEYAIVPVVGGIEGAFFANSIDSDFNGMFVIDQTGIYGTELEVECSSSVNQPSTVVATLARKYPYVIHNPSVRYESGSASGYFVEKKNNDYDTKGALAFRTKLDKFLLNGYPKILKIYDGRMWLIDVTSNITKQEQGHPEFVTTSFEWTETGDCENFDDLFAAGLVSGGDT